MIPTLAGLLSLSPPVAAVDCNRNGVADPVDIESGRRNDCNRNGVPDECDLLATIICRRDEDGKVSASTADMNADGLTDVLVWAREDTRARRGTVVSVVLNEGRGSFSPPFEVSIGPWVETLTPGDFNGDGDQDLAVALMLSGVVIYPNKGDGLNFDDPRPIGRRSYHGMRLYAADLDGNRSMDLMVQEYDTLHIYLNQGGGTLSLDSQVPSGVSLLGIRDFDGDGFVDFMTPFSMAFNAGDGTFAQPVEHGLSLYFSITTVGDFDGDGDPDVASAGESGVQVSLNNGHGQFSQAPVAVVGIQQPRFLVAGDFDADGDLDLLTSSGWTPVVLLNRGDGTSFEPG